MTLLNKIQINNMEEEVMVQMVWDSFYSMTTIKRTIFWSKILVNLVPRPFMEDLILITGNHYKKGRSLVVFRFLLLIYHLVQELTLRFMVDLLDMLVQQGGQRIGEHRSGGLIGLI